ncbi:MAG TPA: TlpA disulfide reductase family protein [Polyangiaceae bacterium]|nr:TlpA disulfide reductase family protein [Polyangiaceae bacterium]
MVGSRRAARVALAAVVSASPCLVACGGAAGSTGGAETAASTSGATPPDFELEALDGESVRLADHLGKEVVLIDFWATFCEPCLASMPHLDELYRKYKGHGFAVFGVSIDGPESVAQVRSVVGKLGVTFPILLDQETRVVALYNPKTSAPYSVLIGKDGRIRAKREGYSTGNAAALEADIVAALGGS